ncbi:MAG TPA: S-layer homology domain-containing protein [Thermoanaerobaculia bacterium]|nr:S-layer homology domain-containing protein [Thermoanaerobaculia bacterium]
MVGVCGPFTDVAADSFCPFVLEIFYLGITTGTTPTTYDPTATVSRLQMAAFLSRTVDGVLLRGGRRGSLGQFWTTQNSTVLGLTTVGSNPQGAKSDGADIWVACDGDDTVSRVRGSDGKLLETWTGATLATGVLSAMGKVFVTGQGTPGLLYRIDPSLPAGVVTTVASSLGTNPRFATFDGARIWTGGSGVSIVTPGATIPWTVTVVTSGFQFLIGIIFDGSNVWVADQGAGELFKLDASGGILQTVTIGLQPWGAVFDGSNIWVANSATPSVSVVRASTGAVLATLTGNGLDVPYGGAFDGRRVLFANVGGGSISLWKAADLTSLGSFSTGGSSFPYDACSDGTNFWIPLLGPNQLARF